MIYLIIFTLILNIHLFNFLIKLFIVIVLPTYFFYRVYLVESINLSWLWFSMTVFLIIIFIFLILTWFILHKILLLFFFGRLLMFVLINPHLIDIWLFDKLFHNFHVTSTTCISISIWFITDLLTQDFVNIIPSFNLLLFKMFKLSNFTNKTI